MLRSEFHRAFTRQNNESPVVKSRKPCTSPPTQHITFPIILFTVTRTLSLQTSTPTHLTRYHTIIIVILLHRPIAISYKQATSVKWTVLKYIYAKETVIRNLGFSLRPSASPAWNPPFWAHKWNFKRDA